MKKVTLLTALLLIKVTQILAQYAPEFEKYKSKYPEAHNVFLNLEEEIHIDLVNDKIEINSKNTKEILYLGASAKYDAKESVRFSSFFELEGIQASTLVFKNGGYKEIKVKDFKEKDELSGMAFYDDTKSINFVYPNLTEGAKTKLITKEIIKNPRFLNTHYFGEFAPVINNKFKIVCNKNINIEFREFNTENITIVYNKTVKKGKNVYTWEIKDVNKYESERNAPNYKTRLPHIIPIITSYKVKNKTINLLDGVDGLYNWYYSLIENVNKETPNKELVNIVNELVKDKESDLEKVKAIYYWAQKNIKYVAFEYALGGFIPRDANDVFKKKYGDCKDNSSILLEMLKIANLKGHLTWIGTRSIPYQYEEVPTPVVDNHMILTYFDGDKPYFLDATGRFHSLNHPSSFIQGKEALIAQGQGKFLIKKVPIVEATKNAFIDSISLTLKDGILKGNGKLEVSGYNKIGFYNSLERQKNNDDLKEYYNYKLRKGNNKFLVEDFKELNKYEYDKNFQVSYSFNIEDYISQTGNEIFINLNLDKNFTEFKIKKDRVNDFEISDKNLVKFINEFEVPENYKVNYIPENLSIKNDLYSADIKYTKKGNKIIYEHQVILNFLILKKKDQKEFNGFIKKIAKAYKETIVLEKIK